MTSDREHRPAHAREAATLQPLCAHARQLQQDALAKSPQAPRFLMEAARSMAQHMRMSEAEMLQQVPAMAFWQLYLPLALANERWDFAKVRDCLPASYACVRDTLQALEAHDQVVAAASHMAAFPLVSTLVGSAWREIHDGERHMLIATRNLGWLRQESSRWIFDSATIIGTRPQDLRLLVAGLKQKTIKRLLILVDGPQPPGSGTHTLDGISSALGFRTGLLQRIHALGIPLQPFTHHWDADTLLLEPQATLSPATVDAAGVVSAIATHIETQLRHHPEQWLNWGAARIRT